MIILMGYLYLEPSDIDAFDADMRTSAAITRAEKGCLFYGLSVDNAQAGRMLLAQRWQDQASLDAHLDTPNTLAFLSKWGSRFIGDLLQYDAANERALAA